MTNKILWVFFLIQLSQVFSYASLEKEMKCKSIWDSDCLSGLVQKLLPGLLAGNPGLGIGPIDVITADDVQRESHGLKYSAKNIKIEALRHTIVKKINVNKLDKRLRVVFQFPTFVITSNYTSSGNINSVPFEGEGEALFKLYDLENEMIFDFDLIKDIHAEDYIDLKNFQYWFDALKSDPIYFSNLFNGDKEKSAAVHRYIDENWKTLWQKYGHVYLNGFNEQIYNVLRIILHFHPLESFVECSD